MPLAPRPGKSTETKRSSVSTAAGQAAKRARMKGQPNNNMGKGTAQRLADYPSLDWEDVADEVVHVTDISGKVTQSQMGAGGYYTMNVAIPMSYIHAAVDAALASQDGMLYIRIYKAPLELFTRDDGNGDDSAT